MKRTVLGLALLSLLTAGGAFAANTATGTLTVNATVSPDCTVSSPTLDFGSLGVSFLASDKQANTNLTYTCTTNGVAPVITLGQGANAAGGSTDPAPLRRMKSGANYISYALYSDSGYSVVWGNTGGTGVSGTADGTLHTATVYGVATHTNVPAGTYTDSVTVTITF
jgi:spore coat protein U-like protein